MPALLGLDTDSFPLGEEWFQFLDRVQRFSWPSQDRLKVFLGFFEPSTRTRLAFEKAVLDLGGVVTFLGSQGLSLAKGESLWETLKVAIELNFDAYVIRVSDDFPLAQWVAEELEDRPFVCGGWGTRAHPTQAWLDSYFVWKRLGGLKGTRWLFVGDGRFSRVLASIRQWLGRFSVQMGVAMMPELLPEDLQGLKVFDSLADGLKWAQVVYGLRWQKERWPPRLQTVIPHKSGSWQLTAQIWTRYCDTSVLLLHPQPVGWGQEWHDDMREIAVCAGLWDSLKYSVKIRQAALLWALGLWPSWG